MNLTEDDLGDLDAPGWAAIDGALRPIYGEQEPLHWGTAIPYMLGGPDPIDGISAYPRAEPVPHWHLVTYGFSELYEKEEEEEVESALSGYGFELTFRPTRPADEERPPNWVLSFLQNLGRYVFSSGNAFGAGHHMDLNGPIARDRETPIRAIAFAHDPEMPAIDTPNGSVEFLQVVGLTRAEYLRTQAWNTEGLLQVMASSIPLLVTDLDRRSVLEDSTTREILEARTQEEGSSTSTLYNDGTTWERVKRPLRKPQMTITFGANPARHLALVLPGRLPFGRELSLMSKEQEIFLRPGPQGSWWVREGGELALTLDNAQVSELVGLLQRGVGEYRLSGLDRLAIRIVPSIIRDPEGNVVDRIE
jgi:hypothetical protein